MHCYVTFIVKKYSCFITFIYAGNEPGDRVPLWRDLINLSQGISEPWVMLGDFNTTLFSDERIRDGVIIPSDLSELESLVCNLDLADLRYNGVKLTWCNQRQNERRL